MADRGHRTVDFSDLLPMVVPPRGQAGMFPARRLHGDGQPPNMPAWPTNPAYGNERADIALDPGRRVGRWLW